MRFLNNDHAEDAANEKQDRTSTSLFLVFLLFLISAAAYLPYFQNGWYSLDDYTTLGLSGAGSFLEMSKTVTGSLYSDQGRFQPVRLSIFVFFSRLFGEEQSVFYNFALHLLNLGLLFYLLRKFRMSPLFAFLTALSFSVFGRWRSMESSSTMIGGSGLNLFFILATILLLIRSSESKGRRRYFYYVLSVAAYSMLVFSYEVAFPLIIPVFAALYFFSEKEVRSSRAILRIIPYIAILLFYLFAFKLSAKGSYAGASINISAEILIRFKSYLLHTLIPPIQANSPLREGPVGLVFLALYYSAVYIAFKGKRDAAFPGRENGIRVLLFGAALYFSSMILFCLNRWETPTSVMPHHTYLITAGGSIVLMSILFGLQGFFPLTKRKYYTYTLILIILPLILLRGVNFNYRFYKDQAPKTDVLKNIRGTVQASIKDGDADAVLLKNFKDYYGITSVNGALAKWSGFKKVINSGREIVSVKGDQILYKGPLSIYIPAEKVYRTENSRAEIFYFENASKRLLGYESKIDFKNGSNLHQLDQVWRDCLQGCENPGVLEAILRNPLKGTKEDGVLELSFASEQDAKRFLSNLKSFELNGEKIKPKAVRGGSVFVSLDNSYKFIFIKIESVDREFKNSLNSIEILKERI